MTQCKINKHTQVEKVTTINNNNSFISIVSILEDRFKNSSDDIPYIFLEKQRKIEKKYSYKNLEDDINRISSHINSFNLPVQSRVLLLLPQDFQFITSFFSCLALRLIAVPAYPPKQNRNIDKLNKIIDDCKPELILTTSKIMKKLNCYTQNVNLEYSGNWIIVDELIENNTIVFPSIIEDDVAFLQYTSGSTGDPKGVMITHKNIIANQNMIKQRFNHSDNMIGVGILPFFHDMGLIGNVLQPIFTHGQVILIPTIDIIKSPLLWLKTISDYKATTSGGPNFIYDLCNKNIQLSKIEILDLSTWKIAFIGAEPVQHTVIKEFSKKFKNIGFKKESFLTCYGMAEATLIISGSHPDKEPMSSFVNKHDYFNHTIKYDKCSKQNIELISSGTTVINQDIKILNFNSSNHCKHIEFPRNKIGEIAVSGDHIALGYWNKPELTKNTFKNEINKNNYLRTGDLGFLDDNNELYITGRIKDMIIIRGKNYVPSDLEAALNDLDERIQNNKIVCFSDNKNDNEELITVLELSRKGNKINDHNDLLLKISEIFSNQFGIVPDNIVLIKPYSLPITSSGKVQRSLTKKRYLANDLDVISIIKEKHKITSLFEISMDLKRIFKVYNIKVDNKTNLNMKLSNLGLDSLQKHQLLFNIEQKFSIKLPNSIINDNITINDLEKLIKSIQKKTPNLEEKNQSVTKHDIKQFNEWLDILKTAKINIQSPRTTSAANKVAFENSLKRYINFSSYNYLGLSTHKNVIRAAKSALDQYGLSASSSPLAGGYTKLHYDLEEKLRLFYNLSDDYGVTIFNSGYSANTGSISSLFNETDTLLCDEYAHMSILEGCKLSGANIQFFKHNNMEDLENKLQNLSEGNVTIIVEGLYSTEGSFLPVDTVVKISKKYNAKIMIDEAHSALCYGKNGHGIINNVSISDIDFIILTFSKAFGAIGGALIAKKEITNYVNFHAKSRMFSCALDPAVTAGIIESLTISSSEEGKSLRCELSENAIFLRSKLDKDFNVNINDSCIVSIKYGDENKLVNIKHLCDKGGIHVGFLQYPAVPKHESRIRLFISSQHTKKELDYTASFINEHKKIFLS